MRSKTRIAPFELKGITDAGDFSGYASVFGVVDGYGEVVEPGAFASTLAAHAKAGTAPAMLWQHRPSEPIGVWRRLAEDGKGLYVEGALALKTSRGGEAHELLKMGALKGLSIGYDVPPGGAEIDRAAGVVRLRAIDLWETSIVTFPANPAAQIDAIKAALSSPKDFERVLREAGFSRSLARRLMSGGYEACRDLRDVGDDTDTSDVESLIVKLTARVSGATRRE